MSIDEARVRAALARLVPPDELPAQFLWQPLPGGVNARSVRVTFGNRDWALRLPHQGAAGLLDVASEARVLTSAARADIAPRVVGIDVPSGVLATEYLVHARPWDPVAAREAANVERAARLLRALHEVTTDAPRYAAAAIAESYLADPVFDRSRLEEQEVEWARDLSLLAQRYDVRHPPSVLCHNDLVAANVLDDGDLKLVDFEYAVLGAPILDLAGLAAMNDYSAAQCAELLGAYYGGEGAPFSLDELAEVVRMLRLMAYFWARIGAARAGGSAGYARIAEEMLEFLK